MQRLHREFKIGLNYNWPCLKIIIEDVEVAQKLRKVAALAEDPGSVPIIYMVDTHGRLHNYL